MFFIGLIISITPGFAVEISGTINHDDTEELFSDLDQKTNELEVLKNEMSYHANNLNESMKFIRDNAWNFWKYGEVKQHMNQMITELNQEKSLAETLKATALDVQSDANKLINSLNETKSKPQNDDKFLTELENRTNTTFEVTDPVNFKKGDIVQYKGQGGSNRYLEYLEIDNKTSYVILLNSENKRIALSQEFFNKTATHKISPKTPNHRIISTIDKMQQEKIDTSLTQIQKKIVKAQKMKATGAKIKKIGLNCVWVSCICAAIWVFAVLVGITFSILSLPALIVMIVSAVVMYTCAFTGAILIGIGGVTEIYGNDHLKEQHKNLEATNALAKDLSEPLNSFPFASNMNLTTSAALSINGTLNGTDFDNNNLTYTMVQQPKYGVLNISQNGSFIYTPKNNFTGQDSFKYKVTDGIVDSNIATVNISVLTNTTKLVVGKINGKIGDRVNLTAVLKDRNGKGIANVNIIFKINNKVIGYAKTNKNGLAILNYLLRGKGKFTLLGLFPGNNLYTTSNSSSLISVVQKKRAKHMYNTLQINPNFYPLELM
jgi:VCBS repeat-containing protein